MININTLGYIITHTAFFFSGLVTGIVIMELRKTKKQTK